MVTRVKKNHIAAGEFKAKCLQIMDRVVQGGQPVIVTKRGKPMVRIVPVEEPDRDAVFGCLKDRFQIVGDVEQPVLPASSWSGRK